MQTDITDRPPPPGNDAPCTEIEYVLDPEDRVSLQLFLDSVQGPSPPPSRMLCVRELVILLAILLGMAVLLWWCEANPKLIVMDVLAALGVLFLIVVLVRNDPPEPTKDRRLLVVKGNVERLVSLGVIKIGRRDRVSMDADGFTEFNEYREDRAALEVVERKETRVPWSEVASIDVGDRHAFFEVISVKPLEDVAPPEGSSLVTKGYLIVPKRAFDDEQTFLRFVETARNLRQSHLLRSQTGIVQGSAVDGVQLPL
jgi:hypothetical protein